MPGVQIRRGPPTIHVTGNPVLRDGQIGILSNGRGIIVGNGSSKASKLTPIELFGLITVSPIAPISPAVGDLWIDIS